MSNVNGITVIGNLTADPDLRYTPNGAAVVQVGLAVNRSFKKGDEWVEETDFVDVTAWQQLAENVAESLKKGDRVVITGRIHQDRWEDKESGENRSKVGIVADEIAPGLRFATVSGIVKNPKKGGGDTPVPHPAELAVDEDPF